jgi:hypothetical protein
LSKTRTSSGFSNRFKIASCMIPPSVCCGNFDAGVIFSPGYAALRQ